MYLTQHPGRVITTEVIASLFGKAWPLAFTPVTIMGESGAYPLNPGVIDDRQVAPSLTVPTSVYRSGPDSHSETMQFICPTFSPEQEALFRRRIQRGI